MTQASDIAKTAKYNPIKVYKATMRSLPVKAPNGTTSTAFNTCQSLSYDTTIHPITYILNINATMK